MRPPSRITRMSGWPRLVRKAVRAVLPVRMALIARVVPWMNRSVRPSRVSTASPRSAAASASAANSPRTGSSGVVDAL